MKTLLSLYDKSGVWSGPFADAGWNVILWDLGHQTDYYRTFTDVMDATADYFYDHIFDNYGTVDGILIAQPCTDFATSGARWFAEKDANGVTDLSIELTYQSLRIVDLCNPDFWALEQPVSRIHNLVPELGPPMMYFNPCDFGDPYNKKTALYGEFNTNLKRSPVAPLEGSKMHRKYGGKSDRTKELRSVTPPGFADAFFQANKNWSRHEQPVQLSLF